MMRGGVVQVVQTNAEVVGVRVRPLGEAAIANENATGCPHIAHDGSKLADGVDVGWALTISGLDNGQALSPLVGPANRDVNLTLGLGIVTIDLVVPGDSGMRQQLGHDLLS